MATVSTSQALSQSAKACRSRVKVANDRIGASSRSARTAAYTRPSVAPTSKPAAQPPSTSQALSQSAKACRSRVKVANDRIGASSRSARTAAYTSVAPTSKPAASSGWGAPAAVAPSDCPYRCACLCGCVVPSVSPVDEWSGRGVNKLSILLTGMDQHRDRVACRPSPMTTPRASGPSLTTGSPRRALHQ